MFILNINDTAPLYKQLYKLIREHVLSGKLPAHAKLPSVRELASELSTSRNTVEGAYLELHAEGYIYSRPRGGYFVSALDHNVLPFSLAPIPRKQSHPPQTSPSYTYDFHPARLDPACFPSALWRTCFLECLRESSRELSRYGDPQGDWGLRVYLGTFSKILSPALRLSYMVLPRSLLALFRAFYNDYFSTVSLP
jgi:GntR family transcriptional regulator / MocR family aminotransferase